MTAGELIERLRVADPDATVVFLPWGADEDELENVGAVAVFEHPWTRECCIDKRGHIDEFLYPGEPRREGRVESDDVVFETVKVVVMSVDEEFLRSRRFT